MPKTPRHNTAIQILHTKIAEEMTQKTHYTITPDMVTYVKGDVRMNVYAAQYGDVTVLCWVRPDGEFKVKSVFW